MRIAILAIDGSLQSSIVGLADLFWMTNQSLRGQASGSTDKRDRQWIGFETVIASPDGRDVTDAQGRRVQVDCSFTDLGPCDAVLVAGMALDPDGAPPRSEPVVAAARLMKKHYLHGALAGGACAGAFVIGESGLLDGKRCTTTWWLHPLFKRRFPKARTVWGSALEEQLRVVTSAGPLSWIDLGLHVIRLLAGPEVARVAANIAVTDNTPLPHSIYAPQGFVNSASPLLLEAERIVRHEGTALTAAGLAKALNLSERTFHRRMEALTGETPKAFITRVRVETACLLLQSPGAHIKQVAGQAGYADESSFRRAFLQQTGLTPSGYREWARNRQA